MFRLLVLLFVLNCMPEMIFLNISLVYYIMQSKFKDFIQIVRTVAIGKLTCCYIYVVCISEVQTYYNKFIDFNSVTLWCILTNLRQKPSAFILCKFHFLLAFSVELSKTFSVASSARIAQMWLNKHTAKHSIKFWC